MTHLTSRRTWLAIGGGLLKLVLLLLAVSVIVFALVALSPIDPVKANAGTVAYLNMSEEKRAQLVAYWGTDLPIWQRYFNWLGGVLQGDLGHSLRFNQPVADFIAERFARSAVLLITAWILSGLIGFALGVLAGAYANSVLDRAIQAVCFVLAATPTFWLGMLMLMLFAVYLDWFPVGYSAPLGTAAEDVTLGDNLRHIILPALTLSIAGISNTTLHTREKMIDVSNSDFFRFARARGLNQWEAIRRHGLRHVITPALTLQFASIAEIFGGSVLVESVFNYPGLGQATIDAGLGGDLALLAGIALVTSAIVFIGNAIANLLYIVIDPRQRRSQPVARPAASGVEHVQ